MAAHSTMLPLGTKAPEFSLHNAVDGQKVTRDQYAGQPLLVMFICNHCPYVVHIRSELGRLARDYGPKGLAMVAINSNSTQSHPEDGPENMKKLALSEGWPFPFLPGLTRLRARRSSTCLIATTRSSIEGSWTTADLDHSCRRRVRICAPRSTPCSPNHRSATTKSRALAAASSGDRATSQSTYVSATFESMQRPTSYRVSGARMATLGGGPMVPGGPVQVSQSGCGAPEHGRPTPPKYRGECPIRLGLTPRRPLHWQAVPRHGTPR